eukprot:6183000-Pleurochrysis_carterae.AAC.1
MRNSERMPSDAVTSTTQPTGVSGPTHHAPVADTPPNDARVDGADAAGNDDSEFQQHFQRGMGAYTLRNRTP